MIEILFDELCPFRTTETVWCISWGKYSYERDKNARFIPKSISEMNQLRKVVEVPEWFAIKEGYV